MPSRRPCASSEPFWQALRALFRYAEGCSVYVGGLEGDDEMFPEQLGRQGAPKALQRLKRKRKTMAERLSERLSERLKRDSKEMKRDEISTLSTLSRPFSFNAFESLWCLWCASRRACLRKRVFVAEDGRARRGDTKIYLSFLFNHLLFLNVFSSSLYLLGPKWRPLDKDLLPYQDTLKCPAET